MLGLFPLYSLSSSHRKYGYSRTKGSLKMEGQLSWVFRSPCGASSGVAENHRGQAPAA